MQKLWSERHETVEAFNPTNHTGIFTSIKNSLPYKRLYGLLNDKELLQIIKDAKQNRWELLDLSECGLKSLPDELWSLKDLKGLWLNHNNITILPKNIEKLQNLELLDISFNPMIFDADEPINLPKLVNLNCYKCKFSQLPKALQIPSLTVLSFKCLNDTLSDDLFKLKNLKELYLLNSKIEQLPNKIKIFENLECLNLSCTKISAFPNYILKLKNLKTLDLSGSNIQQLPNDIELLKNLENLNISATKISILPDSITNLKNLKTLNLFNTQIEQLPDNIGLLENLRVLNLSYTKISILPDSIANLKNLQYLGVNLTPLAKKIPPEILRQGAKSVIRYVLEMQSDKTEKEFFNESKMVIVGHGNVGKTCVLNRLIHNTYVEKPSTEGIDIQTWDFEELGENYRLNVWDFGGQEIYHSTHQFFLSQRSLYLFVWDALAEDEYGRIDYWLKTIKSLAGDSPIIIVVNKCDIDVKRIKSIDTVDIKRRFPQVVNFLHISCKDGTGIDNLRNLVIKTALELPLMKQKWFASWLNVRKEIEERSKSENIIYYNEYLKICKNNGIEDRDEALSLIRFLHDLGIVLYYHDDYLLKNIVILSSEWGTDAVYKVLDEKEKLLKGKNGILPISLLPKIWNDTEQYPPECHHYLLSLMEKFQLAFKVDNEHYLVAELLENKEITLNCNFPHDQTLGFRYEYDFIPAGIMTRFIVLANEYLIEKRRKKQCWAKGAYLKYGNAYALVRLHDNLSERFVEIKISGGLPRERRAFLTIIRKYFNDINKRFKGIIITEQIPCNCSDNCINLFNYNDILKGYDLGENTLKCTKTWKEVNIGNLLDGVERIVCNPEDMRRNSDKDFGETIMKVAGPESKLIKIYECIKNILNILKEIGLFFFKIIKWILPFIK